jgi:hypothetical protein
MYLVMVSVKNKGNLKIALIEPTPYKFTGSELGTINFINAG